MCTRTAGKIMKDESDNCRFAISDIKVLQYQLL